jgi:hypothetical protein
MWTHIISGMACTILTYIYCLLAMKESEWKIDQNYHSIAGFIVMIVCGVIVLGGFAARFALQRLRWRTSIALALKLTH